MDESALKIDPARLRSQMEKHEIGQSELARRVGMTQGGIHSILKGAAKRPGKLKEIAAAVKTSEDYLLRLTDDPEPAPSAADFFELYRQLPPASRRAVAALAEQQLKEHSRTKKAPASQKPASAAKVPAQNRRSRP